MTLEQEFFVRFNSRIMMNRCAGMVYETRLETQAEKDYAAEEQKARETMPEHQLEKWYDDHEMPGPEYKSRFIPDNEDWDEVHALMQQSLDANADLLWERYKNNAWKYENDCDY
jgi:hypothetical protein